MTQKSHTVTQTVESQTKLRSLDPLNLTDGHSFALNPVIWGCKISDKYFFSSWKEQDCYQSQTAVEMLNSEKDFVMMTSSRKRIYS